MDIKETTQFAVSAIALMGVIFTIYRYFREPDVKANKDIELLKQGCSFKHGAIDDQISSINKSISFIKDNHLTHIEASLQKHDEQLVKIFTILEERLPRK